MELERQGDVAVLRIRGTKANSMTPEMVTSLGAIPPKAFAATKESIRRPVLEAIARHEENDAERWLETWFSPEAQERLRAAVAKLGG